MDIKDEDLEHARRNLARAMDPHLDEAWAALLLDDDDKHIETAEIEDPEIRHLVELVERAYDDLSEALHDLRQLSGRVGIPARGAGGAAAPTLTRRRARGRGEAREDGESDRFAEVVTPENGRGR